ncbi:hypothetical protein GGR23_004018 [Gellertiella hungarica]|uniref:Uncharacterized protein n=1 Tax=Gellertiella hungarica TaxID=1572859 RepID=A0A7W6NLR6_9HYPH|nr:hypothetical protein [Gellertiella hungarica]
MTDGWIEEIAPAAWRWSCDQGETWHFGPKDPRVNASNVRSVEPDIVEPMYSATALSAAHEAGRLEEREALERTLKHIRMRSSFHPDDTEDDLKRQMRHIHSVSDAAIRSREGSP